MKKAFVGLAFGQTHFFAEVIILRNVFLFINDFYIFNLFNIIRPHPNLQINRHLSYHHQNLHYQIF